jgi:hypothetical protein
VNRKLTGAVLAFVVMIFSVEAGGQVGHTPETSPFRDLEFRQEASLYTGYFRPQGDPVGVAPRGGPMIGARYDVLLGNPAAFFVRAAYAHSERTSLNPYLPAATRNAGDRSVPLLLADIGISVNLTGQKSWHNFVPIAFAGVGVASDLGAAADTGGYRFGTPFALSAGGGVRWVPGEGSRFQARLDVTDYLYQIRYPNTYFNPASDGTRLREPGDSQSRWTHNTAITVGASYLFFR